MNHIISYKNNKKFNLLLDATNYGWYEQTFDFHFDPNY
jgi:hypothetical protein